MTQKSTTKKKAEDSRDEHELLQQDDFGWLNEFRDILSPYWSSRLEYQPEKKAHVLVVQGTEPRER